MEDITMSEISENITDDKKTNEQDDDVIMTSDETKSPDSLETKNEIIPIKEETVEADDSKDDILTIVDDVKEEKGDDILDEDDDCLMLDADGKVLVTDKLKCKQEELSPEREESNVKLEAEVKTDVHVVKGEDEAETEKTKLEDSKIDMPPPEPLKARLKGEISNINPVLETNSTTDTPDTISESDNEEAVYKISFDLDDLVASTLNEFRDPEKDEDAKKYIDDLNGFGSQMKLIEKRQKDISRIFADCAEKLAIYQKELEEADRIEELKEAAAEFEAKEAAEANAKCEETDSDDDVQFISSSFDTVNKQFTTSLPLASESPLVSNLQAPPRTVLLKIPPNMQENVNDQSSLEHMRAAFRGALNQSVNSNLNAKTQLMERNIPVSGTVVPKLQEPKLTALLTSKDTKIAYQKDSEAISVNSKVLAKKFNDIWYKGTVVDFHFAPDVAARKYTVKFDGKGKKTLPAFHVAYSTHLSKPVSVGTRVIAMYRDEDSMASFYAGIVAETPNGRNQFRYLIFFDDGYAQYSTAEDIHKVIAQSENVWNDIHPDSQEFIKDYLRQYPERPMVRLHKGQAVRTEWNGTWWTAKVEEVDSSLAKMFFLADKRTEWIYRGSTRLEPLFKALAKAEVSKNSQSSKLRRHNLDAKGGKKPVVEYTRGVAEYTKVTNENVRSVQICQKAFESSTLKQLNHTSQSESDKKRRSVAKKSTTNSSPSVPQGKWEAPWLKLQRKVTPAQPSSQPQSAFSPETSVTDNADSRKSRDMFAASSISSNKQGKDMATVLQERLSKVADSEDLDEESLGERLESVLPLKDKVRTRFKRHRCSKACLHESEDDPERYKGTNPLLIPLLCGWERHVCKTKPSNRRYVLYRTPCSRRVRNIQEADQYLMRTNSNLRIDLFCFDPVLHVHTEFVPVKTFCDIKDLSYGKENVPISCVNGIDRQYPDYVEYSNVRIPTKGVKLNLDPEFLLGCDCTDGCRDKSKCRCQQMTVESTTVNGGKLNPNAGYQYKRLMEPLVTGLYECNSQCKCDCRCINRVAQNPLSVRLQVFKTEKRGWGLRCLDDIPSGGFICIYAGQLLTEQGANEDGQQYGDEYLAELDYMEVVERQKEGYESDANSDEGLGRNSDFEDDDDDESDHDSSDSDSDFAGDKIHSRDSTASESNPHHTRTRAKKDPSSTEDSSRNLREEKPACKLVLRRDSSRTSDHDEWSVKLGINGKQTSASAGTKDTEPILIDDDDDEDDEDEDNENNSNVAKHITDLSSSKVNADTFIDSDSLPDLDDDISNSVEKVKHDTSKAPPHIYPEPKQTNFTARRSTSGKLSRFKNLPDPKKKLPMTDSISEDKDKEDKEEEKPGTRSYFQDGQACYIMDAKSIGNIGRYLNHSCSPNVFVQNVFVDTHDLRFPWVAFFAAQYVRAGTELTWDYNYEVGSVPGKVLYCYCGSADCRGRLL